MTVRNHPESGISLREWVQEHPFASLLGAMLVGLFAGTTINQVVSHRQIGAELVRLSDDCRDTTVAVRQLTRLEPTVDGTRSLLARLQQTEKELGAGVRSLDGIRDLGQNLASARRDLAALRSAHRELVATLETIEAESVRTLGHAQGASVRLQELGQVVNLQESTLPSIERSIGSLLSVLRLLQEHDGSMAEGDVAVRRLLEDRQRVETLLAQLDRTLHLVETNSPGLDRQMTELRRALEIAGGVADDAARLHARLLDVQSGRTVDSSDPSSSLQVRQIGDDGSRGDADANDATNDSVPVVSLPSVGYPGAYFTSSCESAGIGCETYLTDERSVRSADGSHSPSLSTRRRFMER